MSDWATGYIVDIGYSYGYYAELNPLRMRTALLGAGIAAPPVGTACELGFGRGLSVSMHAAAGTAAWWGTDFSPEQAGLAQQLAAVSQSGARLYDQAFAEFCQRGDLPDFDYIGVHGIWSWVSEANRAVIVDFVRRKLKVGGVLYMSYNTMPGWAGVAPLRHLITEHADVMAAPGAGSVQRLDAAIEFVEKLLATHPSYVRGNPQLAESFSQVKPLDRNYATHEYLCRDWLPVPFPEMARRLAPAKLNYACSARYLDHVREVNITAEQHALMQEIPDPIFRETARDFMVNQQFRRDYWVRGVRRLAPLTQLEALRRERFILIAHRPDVPLKVQGALGEVTMQENIYGPILDALADHQVKTLAEIERAVAGKGITYPQLLQALMILTGAGHLEPAQPETAVPAAKKRTDRLNAHLIDLARGSTEIVYLASPVTGGGIAVPRFSMLFLLARAQGMKQPEEWAAACWRLLDAQGLKINKQGHALETAEENIAELSEHARIFADKHIPTLKALEIV